MENQLITSDNSLLLDVVKFEHAQRVAMMLSKSTMVPEHFRGENNVGNCIIALNYADRVGVDPFMVMQKMYIIHGKPAIEAQLQIALFNKSDRFTTLKYKMSGAGDALTCVAYAKDKDTDEEIEGPPVSIELAKSEGWYGKKGSKWKTLPDLMLRYRSAAFFIRVYAPETTLGLYTSEELTDINDVIDVTPKDISIQDEIEQNANDEIIDIEQGDDSIDDEPMTEEEKKEIQKKEIKESEEDEEDF